MHKYINKYIHKCINTYKFKKNYKIKNQVCHTKCSTSEIVSSKKRRRRRRRSVVCKIKNKISAIKQNEIDIWMLCCLKKCSS